MKCSGDRNCLYNKDLDIPLQLTNILRYFSIDLRSVEKSSKIDCPQYF